MKSEAKDVCTGIIKTDSDKNIFPLKIREPMILEANNFLRKKGLFPEDNGDDDEMVFGDDDFPSCEPEEKAPSPKASPKASPKKAPEPEPKGKKEKKKDAKA